jgi:predicted phage terminase large subunit-like protein
MSKELIKRFTPKLTEYIPHAPSAKQQLFLLVNNLEAFYGGAAGGGKSDALLMAALQYADCPGYNAIILRDSYQNLIMADGLIPRAIEWLLPTDAKIHDEGKKWSFPSGATLSFGYLSGPRDHFNYQSAAFQFIGIDEMVNIRKNQALYMFSRLRKPKGMADKLKSIPLRFRGASNPPAREQLSTGAWVKERYIDPETRAKDTIFISAKLKDNRYLDQEAYIESLNQLDPITRAQLLNGDWNIKPEGRMFQDYWFKIIDQMPSQDQIISTIRFWDFAATEEKKTNKEPCYTAGCKMSKTKNGQYIISSMIRERKEPAYLEALVRQTADMDGKQVPIYAEQEGGSGGKITISHFHRNVVPDFVFSGASTNGKSKLERAAPFASQAEAGNILLLRGYWNKAFLDEATEFPDGSFKDQIDAADGAYSKLSKPFQGGLRVRSV